MQHLKPLIRYKRYIVGYVIIILIFSFTMVMIKMVMERENVPENPQVKISGVVRDLNGDPVAGAQVSVSDPDWKTIYGTNNTNDQGSYEVTAEALETYRIFISPPTHIRDDLTYLDLMPQIEIITRGSLTEIKANFTLEPAGNIILIAYDKEGKFMRGGSFSSVYFWPWSTDIDDEPILSLFFPWMMETPTIIVPPKTPQIINQLWEVQGFGRVLLKADNEGEGFTVSEQGGIITINLNYELAKTHFRILNESYVSYTTGGYVFQEETIAMIQKAGEYLDMAHQAGDDRERASYSDQSLNYTLYAGEQLELEKAERDIETYRKQNVTIRVVDENGDPVPNATVTFQQTSHDFLFGIVEKWSKHDNQSIFQLLKEAGINYISFHLNWKSVEPSSGVYNWEAVESEWGIEPLHEMGFKMRATSVLWFSNIRFDNILVFLPDYILKMNLDELEDNVYEHTYTMVDRYKNRIDIWEAINEPDSANFLNLTLEQMIQVIKTSVKAIRDAYPEAPVLINFYNQPEWMHLKFYFPATYSYTSWYFLKEMKKEGVDYDIIGLEFYQGGHSDMVGGPSGADTFGRDLFSISRMLDFYSGFNKTIHVTEISVPSTYSENWMVNWHGGWSEETQAEWLRGFYTIAFSKPYVKSVTWWDASDKGGTFITNGGLLKENGEPKLAYYALKELISSWTTNGEEETDLQGFLNFRGFAGEYNVTVSAPGYRSKTVEIGVVEGAENNFTIEITR